MERDAGGIRRDSERCGCAGDGLLVDLDEPEECGVFRLQRRNERFKASADRAFVLGRRRRVGGNPGEFAAGGGLTASNMIHDGSA